MRGNRREEDRPIELAPSSPRYFGAHIPALTAPCAPRQTSGKGLGRVKTVPQGIRWL